MNGIQVLIIKMDYDTFNNLKIANGAAERNVKLTSDFNNCIMKDEE